MHNPVIPLLEPALGHALRVMEKVKGSAVLFAGGRDGGMLRAHASPATIRRRGVPGHRRRLGRCHCCRHHFTKTSFSVRDDIKFPAGPGEATENHFTFAGGTRSLR
jgi:hypothetical protein